MSEVLTLRLEGVTGKSLHIYVENEFKAEIVCGMVSTESDLLRAVGRARAAEAGFRFLLEVLPELLAVKPDGHGTKDKEQKAAFAEGLERGLRCEFRKLDMGPVMAPEHPEKGRAAFERGWSLGRAIVRAAEIATGKEPA